MITKIKSFILSGMMLLTIAAPTAIMAVPISASAACTTNGKTNGVADSVANGASQASTGQNGNVTCDATVNNPENAVNTLAHNIVNIFSIIVGAAAIVMIIYGGFRYITSGGDSNRVGSAKNTLIYAVIGLIIVALAQIIVSFVLSKSTGSVTIT